MRLISFILMSFSVAARAQFCSEFLPESLGACLGEEVQLSIPSPQNDPFADQVVLQVTGDEAIIDESCYNWVLSPTGSPEITADAAVGGQAISFGPDDYISTPSDAVFTVNGDVTIELWVKFTGGYMNLHQHFLYLGNGNDYPNDNYIMLTFYRSGLSQPYSNNIGFQWKSNLFVGGLAALNTWEHIALVREGNTWRMYRNGVQVSSQANNVNLNMPLYVSVPMHNAEFHGIIDNLRITNGVCRYPGGNAFTPPGEDDYQTCNGTYGDILWSDGSNLPEFSTTAEQSGYIWVEAVSGVETCRDSVYLTVGNPTVELGPDSLYYCGDEAYLLDAGSWPAIVWHDGTTGQYYLAQSQESIGVSVTDEQGCLASDSLYFQNSGDFLAGDTLRFCPESEVVLFSTDGGNLVWSDASVAPSFVLNNAIAAWIYASRTRWEQTCSDSVRVEFVSLDADITITEPACFGGGDGMAVAEGEGLVFDWHGLNPQQLSFGAYLLTISGGDCSRDTVILVNQPMPLGFTSFVEAPTCAGSSDGELHVWPGGGTEPYSFNYDQWTQLAAGSYEVILSDANGCQYSQWLQVPEQEAVCGCTYHDAFNYNPSASLDDGSCEFPCPSDINGDMVINTSDLLDLLSVFGQSCP